MTSSVAAAQAKRALVVGVDQYDDPWQLNGCVNDALAIADILREKFDFSHDDITLLTDAEATKDAILDAFDDLIDATNAGDVVVFYFAGHGSQLAAMRKVGKASGFSTALCPVDVTHPGPELYYILDDEIHERLMDLAERTSYITVIVDACHSGTVTRDLFGDRVRGMPANGAAAEAITIHTKPRRRPSRPSFTSNAGPSGWLSLSDNYVLIAGCRDEEVANEVTPPDSNDKHGALTYFLAKELTEARSGMSYRDVFERAAANVTAHKPNQHPQIEGRIDRAVFGVTELLPMDFAKVVSRNGDRVTLNRGVAHGMTVGSTYDVHPQGTKRIPAGNDAPTSLGTIEIISTGAVQSVGRVTGEITPSAIGGDSRAFEISHARGPMTMAVEIMTSSANVESEVAALRAELSRSPILEIVAPGRDGAFARAYLIAPRDSAGPSDAVPQLGAVQASTWAVVGTSGQLLMAPARVGDEALVRKNLEAVVRYTQALELENPNPRSRLKGKFTLEVLRRDTTGAWHVAKPEMAGGCPVFEDGEAFAFRVTSRHNELAHISVLDFQANYGLDPFFPANGATDRLTPNGVFERGNHADPDARENWIMQGSFADGGSEEQETVKLFVTSTPANFSVLKQEPTRDGFVSEQDRSPLTALFRAAIGTSLVGTRKIANAPVLDDDPDDWTTATTSFIVRKKTPVVALSTQPQRLPESDATVSATGLAADVVVHAGGSGRAPTSETLDALVSALAETGGRVERTLEVGNARVVEGTRGVESPSIEVCIPTSSDEARLLVTTDVDGVVRFHFPDAAATRAMPGSESTHETLTFRIPIAPAASESGTRSALAAFSSFASTTIGNQVLTLVVYPALGGLLGPLGEDIAQRCESVFGPYRARGMAVDDYASKKVRPLDGDGWKRLAAGRALLLLHDGFDLSHGGFGTMPRDFVAELHRLYDGRVFAFDHYTLSHDPRRNAKMLIDAMMLPAETALEVDIIAHGRGGLVARSLIEGGSETLAGAERLTVRNVIFVGTPNGGTPFADVLNIEKTLNVYAALASGLLLPLGGPGAVALFAAAKSAAFKMAAQLKGLSAMMPGSGFLESLKNASALKRPGREPRYFAVASDFEPQEPGLARRLRNVMADKTIAGANDLVVSTKSVLDTPAKYPIVESLVFSQSDGIAHSAYFASALARTKVLKWLQPD